FSYRTYPSAPIAVDGYDAPQDQQPTAEYNEISPAFLATLGLSVVSGREFTRADAETALPVAIVDQTTASQLSRGADPVGPPAQARALAAVVQPGVMPAAVPQSTRVLALRIALAAHTADLLRLGMPRPVLLTVPGIVVRLTVALQVTRLLGYRLYNVSPREPR